MRRFRASDKPGAPRAGRRWRILGAMSPALRLALCALTLTAACGNDEHTPLDAPVQIDAVAVDASATDAALDAVTVDAATDAASSVQVISCSGVTPAATIAATNFMFSPMAVTISVDDVVRVTSVGSHTFTSDTGLFDTSIGQDTCVRFTAAGTFPYHCTVHPSMTGTVTVQ